MKERYVLCGPQGIGKSRMSEIMAHAIGCNHIIDDWNGKDELRSGSLALTSTEYVLPKGVVAFHVEDASGLAALITLLQRQAA